MKAITLHQPWATLVAIGAKRIETRSWSTNYRGPIAIHAAKGFPKDAQALCYTEPFRTALKQNGNIPMRPMSLYGRFWKEMLKFPRVFIIATCDLIGVDRFDHWIDDKKPMRWAKGKYFFELTEEERAFGD